MTQLSAEKPGVVLRNALPEVRQFDKLIRCVMEDFLMRTISCKSSCKIECVHVH
jgi:hypothetical protein